MYDPEEQGWKPWSKYNPRSATSLSHTIQGGSVYIPTNLHRPQQDLLERFIQQGVSTMVSGPVGCGKSSFIRFVFRQVVGNAQLAQLSKGMSKKLSRSVSMAVTRGLQKMMFRKTSTVEEVAQQERSESEESMFSVGFVDVVQGMDALGVQKVGRMIFFLKGVYLVVVQWGFFKNHSWNVVACYMLQCATTACGIVIF